MAVLRWIVVCVLKLEDLMALYKMMKKNYQKLAGQNGDAHGRAGTKSLKMRIDYADALLGVDGIRLSVTLFKVSLEKRYQATPARSGKGLVKSIRKAAGCSEEGSWC